MRAYPDFVSRIAVMRCNERQFKDVLVTIAPTEDNGLCKLQVCESGVGKSKSFDLKLSGHIGVFAQGESLNSRFSDLVSYIECNGFDCIRDEMCKPNTTAELLIQAPQPTSARARDFLTQYAGELDTFNLVPVVSGLRVFLLISDHIELFDARTGSLLSDSVSRAAAEALTNAFDNPLGSRSMLECFFFKGELKITDALQLKGNCLRKKGYRERMAKLNLLLNDIDSIDRVSVASPLLSNERGLRILSATKSLLKPVLLAKRGLDTIVVDVHAAHSLQFSQVKNGRTRVSGGNEALVGVELHSPVSVFAHYLSDYDTSALRPNSLRAPVLF